MGMVLEPWPADGSLADEQRQWFGVCVRLDDLAAMQLAGYDRLAASLSGAYRTVSPVADGGALTDTLARAVASGFEGDADLLAHDTDPSGVRLTAAASYALAAALLIEDGSASALAKAQQVLSQLSRELVQLSHARSRRPHRSA